MRQFQIEKFDVDVARCRISSGKYEVILEPKVMDVLQYLYRHKGEVVSQEQLFESVWPHSTFNPSSVQRCIALLRKALQEDSKNARFLVTHPKRGYCLVLPVEQSKSSSLSKYAYLLALVSVVLLAIWFMQPSQSIKVDYTRLLPVTSSGANESSLSLSPDGKHLAFVRSNDQSRNIWLREVASGREVKLTDRDSGFHSLGWKPDGSALVFMENADNLSQMSYLPLDMVRLIPLSEIEIHSFANGQVSSGKLQWRENNHIYFVERDKNNNDIWLSYVDLNDNTKHQLMKAEGTDWLLTLALSPDQNELALGYEMGQNRYRVDLLNLDTQHVSSLVEVEDSIQGVSWHPSGDAILISNRARLQLVEMDGALTQIKFNNYKFVQDAQFDPAGSEIFMGLRNVDVDILRKTRATPDTFETLVDTSSLDFLPIFSPDDSRFVFQSQRTGLKQLYVYKDGQQRLVFSNPNNEELFGVVWTPDGSEIIAASNDKLFRIDVKSGSYTETPHGHQPFGLREHFNNEDALLVSYRADDGVTFHLAKLNLNNMELSTYETEGERLVCYSMALGAEDQIYFANNKEVFRINEEARQEKLWVAGDDVISGLRVKDRTLSLRLDKENEFRLVTIDLGTGLTNTIHQGTEDGDMLINTSNDETQFLYLSKPIRTSELVRLQ